MIDPHRLDFGEVWETDQFAWPLLVESRSGRPVIVSASGTSCGNCNGSTTTTTLQTGSAGELKLSLDLRDPCASTEPRAVRDAKIPVYLTTSAQAGAQRAELRGRVKRAVVVPVRTIDFGHLSTGTDPRPRVLTIRALMAVQELTAAVDGQAVRAELKAIEKSKWEVRVFPLISAGVGRHTATVRLTPTLATGEVVPATNLPVEFDVLHDIQPDTSLIVLGAGSVGDRVRGTLTVASRSNRPFARPTCDAGAIVVRAADTHAPQSSHRFEFEHLINAVGNHTTQVVVRGIDADGRPFEFRVEAQWYGISPKE